MPPKREHHYVSESTEDGATKELCASPNSSAHDLLAQPTQLQRWSAMIETYEGCPSLTNSWQQDAIKRLLDEMNACWMSKIPEDDFQQLTLLMARGQYLLKDAPSVVSEPSTCRHEDAHAVVREKKPIDTRGLLQFTGEVLEYPKYRANIIQGVVNLPSRTPHEKFIAIYKTLDRDSRGFLADVQPENPDIDSIIARLDKEYLNGLNVEDALKREVKRVSSVYPTSSVKEWTDFQSFISKLRCRKKSGALNTTLEKALYHALLQKMAMKDQDATAERGDTLKALSTQVDKFVNRARVVEHRNDGLSPEKRKEQGRERDQNRRQSPSYKRTRDRRDLQRHNLRTHAITTAPCLFCRKNHEMKDCPMTLKFRYKVLRDDKRCWRCLKAFERGHTCDGACPNCNRGHHLSLCPGIYKRKEDSTPSREPRPSGTLYTAQTAMNAISDNPSRNAPVYLPSIRLDVSAGQGRKLSARVFLDSGSTDSYVSETFAKALGAQLEESPPQVVHAFGGIAHFQIDKRTELQLMSQKHSAALSLLVMPPNVVAPIEVPSPHLTGLARKLGIHLSTSQAPLEEVDLLIGTVQQTEHFLKNPQYSIPLEKGLVAVESNFGWYLQGRSSSLKSKVLRTFLCVNQDNDCMCQSVDQLLRDPLSSKNDGDLSTDQWIQQYLSEIAFDPKEKRWVVPLPFINKERPQNNRAVVYKTTEYQLRRSTEAGRKEQYDEAINAYLDGDYAEMVHDTPLDAYYIPHHPVVKPGSTTEVRIVMNASFARKGELSLNDTLYKGYSEQNNLFSLLVRWRLHPYVITADLQKAFLQIRVRPEDRRYLRYFWTPKGSQRLQAYQMKSVLFGATSSPFLLYAVLRKMFESAPEPEVNDMIHSFYMDDAFFMGTDLASVQRKISITKRILEAASFPIHKWACPQWMITEGFQVEETKETVKCLGSRWNLTNDHIHFQVTEAVVETVTRREVSRQFGRLFDPLGLLGPFHTYQKLFLKEVLIHSTGWDAPLNARLQLEAQTRFRTLSEVSKLTFPRSVQQSGNYELLGFADASRHAYGAVIYIQDLAQSTTQVLASRSRIVSEKRTIPELELCAAVLLAELYSTLREHLTQSKSVRFFTDSMITLGRIRNQANKYQQYVANRLVTIAKNSNKDQWLYVTTDHNPADALSRGLPLAELDHNQLWLNGPNPKLLDGTPVVEIRTMAIRALPAATIFNLEEKLVTMDYDQLIRFLTKYYESMEQRARLGTHENRDRSDKASLDQLATAAAWRLYQRVAFPEEVKQLKQKQPIKRGSKLHNLDVFLDQRGVMRLNRRLENAALDYEAKYPIIASDHPFVRSFLDRFHAITMAHCSLRRLSIEVGNVLHLPDRYQILRAIFGKCPRCQFLHGTPFNVQPAALPADRVDNEPQSPFLNIGIDLFGPLQASGARKSYGMIFVCSNTRAVHLELIPSRSTGSIIKAFQRFVSRRGVPLVVRSDNEKSFHAANPLLQSIFSDLMKSRDELSRQYRFQWKFQPAKSPFWGGFFERLIGVVKKTLANWPLYRRYSAEELSTILSEVEALVNSRPLTASTLDSSPLTPSHFLIGRSHTYIPPLRMDKERPLDDALLNYVRLCDERDKIWKRLKQEYLTSLRTFHRKDGATREPEIGELVLIVSPSKREDWNWGKIQSLMRGPDQVVRAATIAMPNGNLWERPIQSLIPLEASARPGGCDAANRATAADDHTSSKKGTEVELNTTDADTA